MAAASFHVPRVCYGGVSTQDLKAQTSFLWGARARGVTLSMLPNLADVEYDNRMAQAAMRQVRELLDHEVVTRKDLTRALPALPKDQHALLVDPNGKSTPLKTELERWLPEGDASRKLLDKLQEQVGARQASSKSKLPVFENYKGQAQGAKLMHDFLVQLLKDVCEAEVYLAQGRWEVFGLFEGASHEVVHLAHELWGREATSGLALVLPLGGWTVAYSPQQFA